MRKLYLIYKDNAVIKSRRKEGEKKTLKKTKFEPHLLYLNNEIIKLWSQDKWGQKKLETRSSDIKALAAHKRSNIQTRALGNKWNIGLLLSSALRKRCHLTLWSEPCWDLPDCRRQAVNWFKAVWTDPITFCTKGNTDLEMGCLVFAQLHRNVFPPPCIFQAAALFLANLN